MFEAAKQAARYGHLYREQYKRDDAAGRPRGKYDIGIDDALVFAGIAALSGIIGNATYDAIRAFIARLRKQGLDPKLQGDQINVFIQNVQHYHIEHTSASYKEAMKPIQAVAAQKLMEIADDAEARGELDSAGKLRQAALDMKEGPLENEPTAGDFAKVASKMPAARKPDTKTATKKKRKRPTDT